MSNEVMIAFGPGGRRLWAALVDRDPDLADELNPMRVLAEQACHVQDRCDALHAVCRAEPVLVDNGKGQPVTHPAWSESRQHAKHLAGLIAALRLPHPVTGRRPQRRGGARGVYRPRGGGHGA